MARAAAAKGGPTVVEKIKILAYMDSPTCATGFGTVSRNILEALHKTGKYEIGVFGINYWGDPHEFPYRIWPAGTNQENDPYGRNKFYNFVANYDFDILFVLQDTFIIDFLPKVKAHLDNVRVKPYKIVTYYPIDGKPKPEWLANVTVSDTIVAYSEFGKKQTLDVLEEAGEIFSGDISVIPHGANVKEFMPVDTVTRERFRHEYFGNNKDKFIITNVNRNQQRKDIPRTIQAYIEFKKECPDAFLYLHMAGKDQGWDLEQVLRGLGLKPEQDYKLPMNFGPNQGYPRDILNLIYNASDCVVSTTLGEGMGLGWLEAMATKTPIIMPDNTAMSEFITEDLGFLADSGTNPSLFTVLPNDNEILRPLVDVDVLVKKLRYVYTDRVEAQRRAENAYNWINTTMEWQGPIAKRWVSLFDGVVLQLKTQIKDMEVSKQKPIALNAERF